MHFFKPTLFLLIFSFFPVSVYPQSFPFKNEKLISSKNIELYLQRFVQESHPFGSPAQKKIAQDIRDSLVKFGLNTSIEEFTSKTPNTEDTDGKLKNTTGYNVIGFIHGSKKCEIMFGGHYDTKYLAGQQFVGANDGGSSTALLLELARVAKQTHIMKCGLYFVFFDGEESLLPNWDDGKNLYGIQDNLYGSRHFASTNKKKFSLIFILDMIGHKNQNLFITQGSNNYYANKFISACQNTVISKAAIYMEDDHSPFLKFHFPLLHIIDWINLNEWHTVNDNLNIISYDKIAQLGENILHFLGEN